MRLFIAGDTHGNTEFLCDYLYPTAAKLKADVIIQLGDFGYWEHEPSGVDFLDDVQHCAARSGIALLWLHGNHDKHSLALKKYSKNKTTEGFIICRPGVNYIPQGHAWVYEKVRFRSFGGAYSIDKKWRLEEERKSRNPESLWFPEEEMSDYAMDRLLADNSTKQDVIFSHDKPRAANPGKGFDVFPECMGNQDRLQRALVTHKPALWFHGHLHRKYEDTVRAGDDDTWTTVYGLDCDSRVADSGSKPEDAWCLLDIKDGVLDVVGSERAR